MGLNVVGGYEGAKSTFEGVKIASYSSKQVWGAPSIPPNWTWQLGDQQPTWASTWRFSEGDFNLDPDADADGWQNLIGTISYSAIFEKTPYGSLLKDEVSWTEQSTAVKASVYYAKTNLAVYTHVDENVFLGAGTSEKGEPWRNFAIVVKLKVNNWSPMGNRSSWAAILGAEVTKVKVLHSSNTAYNPVEGSDPSTTVELAFNEGKQLVLYPTFRDAVNYASGRASESGSSFISTLSQTHQLPSQDLTDEVYVVLPFTAFGTNVQSWSSWNVPVVDVEIRIHILKVDKWIVIQTQASDWKPPAVDPAEQGSPLDAAVNSLTSWLSNPFNLTLLNVWGFLLLLAIVFIILALFAPWIFVFLFRR